MVRAQGFLTLVFLVKAILLLDAFLMPCRYYNGRLSYDDYSNKGQSLLDVSPSASSPTLLLSTSRSNTATAVIPEAATFEETLFEYLKRNDTSTPIQIEAYVTSKRTLGKQLVFVDFEMANHDVCQAMLRQEYFCGDHYEGYKRCLLKGCKLQVIGTASPTRNPGNVVLLIQSFRLLGLPRQLQHLQIILTQCQEGNVPLEEVASASHMEVSKLHQEFDKITKCAAAAATTTETQPNAKALWKALSKTIFGNLPKDPHYPEAADQVKLSKKGNYVLPQPPLEWKRLPLASSSSEGLQEPGSVAEALQLPRQQTTIALKGWVQNRRRFDGNITQLALVDNLTMISSQEDKDLSNKKRLSCLIHPDVLEQKFASVYNNLLAVGAMVWVTGQLMPMKNGKGGKLPFVLWIQDVHLLQSSSRSVTIRHLLDLMASGKIELEEAANALKLPFQEALELQQNSNPTERQWKANQLAVQLQQNKRHAVNPQLLKTLEKYLLLLESNPATMINLQEEQTPPTMSGATLNNNKEKNGGDRPNYNNAVPLGMPGSRWMAKKKPQLEWMGQRIQSVLQSHPDYGQRPLQILDIGGGKGALAHYLGQSLENIQIHVVDIAAGAVQNGAKKAQRLETPVEFQVADASASFVDKKVDLVVALHACGHLSDVALSHAIHSSNAGFVIVPCCFNSNPHLKIPTVTESVSVPEWLGVPPEDWAALKLLAEVQGDITLANEAMEVICAIRADATRRKLKEANTIRPRSIDIYKFPIEYSTRNTVLVGSCG